MLFSQLSPCQRHRIVIIVNIVRKVSISRKVSIISIQEIKLNSHHILYCGGYTEAKLKKQIRDLLAPAPDSP